MNQPNDRDGDDRRPDQRRQPGPDRRRQSDRGQPRSGDQQRRDDRPRYDRAPRRDDRGGDRGRDQRGGDRGRDQRGGDQRGGDQRGGQPNRGFSGRDRERGESAAGRRNDDRPRRTDDRPRRTDDRPRRFEDRPRRFDDRPRRFEDRPRRFDDRPRPEGQERRYDDRPRRAPDRYPRDDRGRGDRRQDRREDRHPAREGEQQRPEPARPASAPADPPIPEEISADELDRDVRAELRALPRPVGDTVARHLVAAGRLVDEDPAAALAHAVAARRRAARIGAVREAVGLAAYQAGEWQTAIAELRTYQRVTGRQAHLAVLADCERALGRPARAIDIYRSVQSGALALAEANELLIVAAGARSDLGQTDAALRMLQVPELESEKASLPIARLRYAYADTLLAAGRASEARDWFARAATADEDAETDAAERLLELDGVVLEEAEAQVEPETQVAPEDQAEVEPEAQAERLVDAYDLVILDLDGVVYVGEEPIATAVEAIARLRRDGVPVVYATNNASRGTEQVAALLTRLGIEASADEVITSTGVAAEALADRLAVGAAVLVVGSDALTAAVREVGLQPVTSADEQPAAVVQGYGPGVGWAELAEACLAIRAGAQWVVTNTDATLPSPRGLLPGNGALVAALRTALSREPDLVIGKPEPGLFTAAARRRGAATPLVVGDRLDTDIEGAHRAGMDSLLVLTGVTDAAQGRAATGPLRPRYLGDDLSALFAPGRGPDR